MDFEFHYYMTYLVAVRAGFSPNHASIIAYSSQYVDDNAKELVINEGKTTEYRNIITQTSNILKPKKTLGKLYPVFHFIPGSPIRHKTKRRDNKLHPLVTTPDSPLANSILHNALATNNPYYLGIAIHAYVDTWAHQNFVGFFDDYNSIKGFPQDLIPDIGHADAMFAPDRTALVWTDPRLEPKSCVINNNQRFMEAAKQLFINLRKHINPQTKPELLQYEARIVTGDLLNAIGPRDDDNSLQKERVKQYQKLSAQPCYGNVELAVYNKEAWFNEATKLIYVETKRPDRSQGPMKPAYKWKNVRDYQDTHWYKFQEAAKQYQQQAWRMINDNVDMHEFVGDLTVAELETA